MTLPSNSAARLNKVQQSVERQVSCQCQQHIDQGLIRSSNPRQRIHAIGAREWSSVHHPVVDSVLQRRTSARLYRFVCPVQFVLPPSQGGAPRCLRRKRFARRFGSCRRFVCSLADESARWRQEAASYLPDDADFPPRGVGLVFHSIAAEVIALTMIYSMTLAAAAAAARDFGPLNDARAAHIARIYLRPVRPTSSLQRRRCARSSHMYRYV